MAKKKEPARPVELDDIYQHKKSPHRFVKVIELHGPQASVKDVSTGKVQHAFMTTTLQGHWRLCPPEKPGADIKLAQDTDRDAKPENFPPLREIAAGQRYRYFDDETDVIEILGPGLTAGRWSVHEVVEDKKSSMAETSIRESWILIVDAATAASESVIKPGQIWSDEETPARQIRIEEIQKAGVWLVRDLKSDFGEVLTADVILRDFLLEKEAPGVPAAFEAARAQIAATKTPDPADPPLTEQGIEPCLETQLEAESDEDERQQLADQLEGVNGSAGQERPIRVNFKNKEGRFFCPCGGALIVEGETTWNEIVEKVDDFRELHAKHLSPMPRPGELPFKSVIRPIVKPPEAPKVDAAPAPVAPVNGEKQPEVAA